MKILVVDHGNKLAPFIERYQLFTEWKDALSAAKKMGWRDPFGSGVNEKIGVANSYQCGDTNVMLIALEEQ